MSPRPRATLNGPSGSSFERPPHAGPDRRRCPGRHSSTRSNRAWRFGPCICIRRVSASNDSRSLIGYLGNRPPGAPSEPHRSSRRPTQRSSASASELHFPHAPVGDPTFCAGSERATCCPESIQSGMRVMIKAPTSTVKGPVSRARPRLTDEVTAQPTVAPPSRERVTERDCVTAPLRRLVTICQPALSAGIVSLHGASRLP